MIEIHGIYNITTKMLIIVGKGITTVFLKVEKLGKWGRIKDSEGKHIFDFQLGVEDSCTEQDYGAYYLGICEKGMKKTIQGTNPYWKDTILTIISHNEKPKILIEISELQ